MWRLKSSRLQVPGHGPGCSALAQFRLIWDPKFWYKSSNGH
jgi:hypothetical protein